MGSGRDGVLSFCRRVLRTPGHHSPDRLRHCPHLPPVSRNPAAQCPGEHGPRGGRERGLSPTAPSQTSRRPLCSLLSTQRGSDAASANRGDPGISARSSSSCRMTSPEGPTPSPFSPSQSSWPLPHHPRLKVSLRNMRLSAGTVSSLPSVQSKPTPSSPIS